ncbi:MAG TPA: response regulator [Alphaproteobacteria bacterium]|jgi:CheY-like chemotaxis protein|nr:response regulator [Alphaproteobacteria bacterium]
MSSVVIVDDQGVNRKVLTSLASTLEPDVQVKAFGDPWQALSYIREHTPDLLITDYQMPAMNGAELIRRFRRVPDCRDVPAMVVTAYEDMAYRATALDAGANDFILSPLDHQEFRLQSRKLLALRHAEMPAPAGEGAPAALDQLDLFNSLVENLSANLMHKIHNLKRIGAELQTLLEASGTPALFVDEALRVRHFTPHAARVYALGAQDIGRPLHEVDCHLIYGDLARDFHEMARTGESVERYLPSRTEAAHFLLRIIPTRHGGTEFIGALITFTDVSAWTDARSPETSLH